MLSAFQAQPIHELKPRDKAKIESLLAYGDRLLVGLSSGSLRIYRVTDAAPPPPAGEASGEANGDATGDASNNTPAQARAVELLREEEKFSRRPVQQLALVKEANLLVHLGDGGVSLHDLQTCALVERLEAAKGATSCTVTSTVVPDAATGVPSLVSRLAVAVKRRVLCWTWRDMELEESVATIGVEAPARSLTWVSGSRLIAGMDAGFALVDVESAAVTPIVKPASGAAVRPEREDAGSELAGVRFGAVSSSGMGYMGIGAWMPKPMATSLGPDLLLLAKDVNTLFTDAAGRAREKRQVPWAAAPEAIGYSYPYLLALQSSDKAGGSALQIRNPDTLSLLQTIAVPGASILHVPQPNISLAHAGKGFLVASDRTIWRMNALPYDRQLAELAQHHRFDEAISLLQLLEDTLIDDKADRIRELMIQKAEDWFHQQKYGPALDLFTDAEAPPDRVVALYPPAVAGELSSAVQESSDENDSGGGEHAAEQGDSAASPRQDGPPTTQDPPATPSKGVLSMLRGAPSTPRKDADTASIRSTASPAARVDSDNMSIRTARTTSAAAAAKSADKPLEGADLKVATGCLRSFLAQARVKIQRYLAADGTLKQDPPELDPETGRPAFANLLPQAVFLEHRPSEDIDWQAELLRTAQLVDTTLFRAYMLASPSLAGPLFRLDNFCNPDVVQNSLYENDRYGDLIDFLHGKKLHRQALEMLSQFGRGEVERADVVPDSMKGPGRTVAYLKQLPPELVDLVLEFVHWPLRQQPDVGMEVFLEDSDNAERLPRDRVLRFLGDIDENLELQYLEHIIGEWHDQTPGFHQRLVDIYVHRLKSLGPSEAKQALQEKLETFLRHSRVYNKGSTFCQLPSDDPTFYESRAIVLSAMGNHKQALSIYVYNMHDYAKAEDYCSRMYLSEQEEQQACLLDAGTTHEKPSFRPYEPSEDSDNKKGSASIFAVLLGLYLRPPADQETRWPQALDLLSRHGARLPASSTLDLMPADLAVSELQNYFVGRIRHATSTLRESQMAKALEGVRRANAERHLLLGPDALSTDGLPHGRSRRVRITEEDHCRVCHKRFGASAVRVYPDNTVVHYGCVGRRPADAGAARRMSGRGWG